MKRNVVTPGFVDLLKFWSICILSLMGVTFCPQFGHSQATVDLRESARLYFDRVFKGESWPKDVSASVSDSFRDMADRNPMALQREGAFYLGEILSRTGIFDDGQVFRLINGLLEAHSLQFVYDTSIFSDGRRDYVEGVTLAEYHCVKNLIRLNLALPPLDLAASFIHELSHLFWNHSKLASHFVHTVDSVTADEFVAVVASAYVQYRFTLLPDYVAFYSKRREFYTTLKRATGLDLNLVHPEGFVVSTLGGLRKIFVGVDVRNPVSDLLMYSNNPAGIHLAKNVSSRLWTFELSDARIRDILGRVASFHSKNSTLFPTATADLSIASQFEKFWTNLRMIQVDQILKKLQIRMATQYCLASGDVLDRWARYTGDRTSVTGVTSRTHIKILPEGSKEKQRKPKHNGQGVKGETPDNQG